MVGVGGLEACRVWKWLLGFFVVIVLLCGGGGYFAWTQPAVQEFVKGMRSGEKALEVRFDAVRRGDLTRLVNAPGTIEPRTNVKISAQVSARIVALPFDEGDVVKAGDVVMRLDPADLTARLESAQASKRSEEARLEGARAALTRATLEAERQRTLWKSRDTSQQALDGAESELRQSQSTLNQAEHSIEIARANIQRAEKDLDNTVIKSPIDGRITRRDCEVGETVVVGTLNNPGSVVMEIADLGVMVMKAKVDESNIAPVRSGQRAKVYLNAFPDRTFTGVVERVGLLRKVDRDQTSYFEVEVLLDVPDGQALKSGLNANADIEVETLRDVLMLPSQAVLDRKIDELPKDVVSGNAHVDTNKLFARVVYRVRDGKTVATPVSIGSSDLTRTVILGGLDEGEVAVVGPFKHLVNMKHAQSVAEEGAAKKKEGLLPAGTAEAKQEPPSKQKGS
ncbi:MAG: efflux RND transporter periplasmic adaptor subunit [Phycisphaerae bacterium]|nr:efflux RND transporter periplasmic adaptor subunit [Phycisphaerae bacterium]